MIAPPGSHDGSSVKLEEHTPGPWTLRVGRNDAPDRCDLLICGGGYILADINGPQYPHQRPNADLIAAAPDAIAALMLVRSSTEWSCMERAITDAVDAAIAKATGQ